MVKVGAAVFGDSSGAVAAAKAHDAAPSFGLVVVEAVGAVEIVVEAVVGGLASVSGSADQWSVFASCLDEAALSLGASCLIQA